jgi:hypothetical protein
MLSSALVVTGAGLIGAGHPAGRAIAVAAGLLSLYWWLCYSKLEH